MKFLFPAEVHEQQVKKWVASTPAGVLALQDKLRQLRKFGYSDQTDDPSQRTPDRAAGARGLSVLRWSELEAVRNFILLFFYMYFCIN